MGDPRNEPGATSPRSYSLVPIEHDPFALAPVEYDPFKPSEMAPDIRAVAPPVQDNQPGILGRMFGAQRPPIQAVQTQAYPDDLDAYYARQFQQTYGDSVAVFDQPGAKAKKMSTDELVEKYRDITGRAFAHATATATTPEERDNILKNWIAAQKSPLSALGFDPRVTIQTPPGSPGAEDLSLAGFYRPDTDTLWYNGDHQDAVVHEAMHRGIQKLRDAGEIPPEAQKQMDELDDHGYGEEYLVRALKLRHFGEIEKMPGADAGNRQVNDAKWFMTDSLGARQFNAAMDALEAAAAKHLAKQHPGGPR